MPDENKIEKLRSIDYRMKVGCGLCDHARFAPGLDWGSCTVFDYTHQKQGVKALSVHRMGCCSAFKFNEKKKADVERSGFTQFIEVHDPSTGETWPIHRFAKEQADHLRKAVQES